MLASWHFYRSRVCPIATPCLSAVARLRMSNAHEKVLSRVDTLTGAVNDSLGHDQGDAMSRAADALMYGAKREGTDRVAFDAVG